MIKRVITKEKILSLDIRLNRHIHHDSKSREFTFDTTGLQIVNVEHERFIPILNQGQVGSCTGNAGIGAINTSPFIQVNNPVYSGDEVGALALYSAAEVIDGNGVYPPNDHGSSGLSIAKALKNAGMISEYQHTFTLNDALKALSMYPIITGTNWYEDMFTPDQDGRVHPTGKLVGGHEYEGIAVDVDNGRIWFCNSWGDSWGVKGRFYMTWADYATLLAKQGDVTVLLPTTNPTPTPAKWKYFKPSEIVGLQDSLVSVLDNARGLAGVPFVITSGFRTLEQNKAVGGVANSAHLRGLAADIATKDNTVRTAVIKGILGTNIPVFMEIASAHVHADVDPTIHPLGDTIVEPGKE